MIIFLAKDEQPEILSSAVLYFFKLFIGVSSLLMKHILELRSMFGKVSNNNANQIFKVILGFLISLYEFLLLNFYNFSWLKKLRN